MPTLREYAKKFDQTKFAESNSSFKVFLTVMGIVKSKWGPSYTYYLGNK